MKYHRRTMESLLGHDPEIGSVGGMEDLPASVAEWYSSLPDATELLVHYSNGEMAVSPEDFASQMLTLSDGRRVCFADKPPSMLEVNGSPLTVFLVENQGVCWWAFPDQPDDPPVYCSCNDVPKVWKQVAGSFSDFVYARIFDHLHFFEEGRFHFEVTEVADSTLRFLEERFERDVTTHHLEGWTEHRFTRGGQRVTVSESSWMISANTSDEFQRLAAELAPFLEELPEDG